MATNQYPAGGFRLPVSIKMLNRDPEAASPTGYYVVDSLSIDFKVQAIITDSGYSPELINGYKYIIGDDGTGSPAIPAVIQNGYFSDEERYDLEIGDVVLYNNARPSGEEWELWYDTSNVNIQGPSGGGFVYVVEEANFYGWNGEEWTTIGFGNTGDTGAAGEESVFGRKYDFSTTTSATLNQGFVKIENTAPDTTDGRTIHIHRYPAGLTGYAGLTADLYDVFFPNGTDSSYNGTNPKVTLSLYNATRKSTYAFRASLNSTAIDAVNNRLIFGSDAALSDKLESFELLSSDSGVGAWNPAWQTGDEIYVLAFRDGIEGNDGERGATGQGITFFGNVGGELYLQYLDENGDPIGDEFPTGIVDGQDGATGEAGQVGFLMGTTGVSASAGGWWGNAVNINPNNFDTSNGQILYVYNYDSAGDYIVLDYQNAESTGSIQDFNFNSFGLSLAEVISGTDYLNRPGQMFFYQKVDKTLQLKSFVSYNKIKANNSLNTIILQGVNSSYSSSAPNRLGITTGSEIYVLPVPRGVQGVGITFAYVENNILYLDYVDSDGNTFGTFATVSGITGNEGQMNPFNLPYIMVEDYNAAFAEQNIQVKGRNGTDPVSLRVSGTAENGDDVYGYISQAINTVNKSGFFSVFDDGDSTNFGVFRFTTLSADPEDANAILFGSPTYPLTRVAGNITDIFNNTDDTVGFTTGERILFALNLDGPKGSIGNTGIGFTYGNEYFHGSARPLDRTNGDPLEIGDKWFCTPVGLEFTFLGRQSDGIVGTGGEDNIQWVQTNNARQGKQGPKGEKGDPGNNGSVGATGINPRGVWSTFTSTIYVFRDTVFADYQTLTETFAGNNEVLNNLATNWGALGASNGYFVWTNSSSSSDVSINARIPGYQSFVTGNWTPVVANEGGPSGGIGDRGTTGDRVYAMQIASDGEARYLEYEFARYNRDGSLTPQGFFNRIDTDIRGPQGPQATVGGDATGVLFKTGTSTITAKTYIDLDSSDIPVLYRYYENVDTVGSQTTSGTLTIDVERAPVQTWKPSVSQTISRMNIVNLADLGDGVTVFIIPGDRNITWNVSSTNYRQGTDSGASSYTTYVSSQGYPTPGKIEIPQSNSGIGAMTIKLIDTDTIAINYLSFVAPEV